jgi:hypothetical protein
MRIETPELAQLYRRYQRYERLSRHYEAVLKGLHSAIVTANPEEGTLTFHAMDFTDVPQSVPRGRPCQGQ